MSGRRGRGGPSNFEAAPHTRAQGSVAERQAFGWLQARGYRILERNWTSRAGEIDCVALDGETLCFIEIKARSSRVFGSAVAAVNRRKQLRIARVASLYLADGGWQGPCRFDVLGLEAGEGGEWRFQLVRNAFDAPSR